MDRLKAAGIPTAIYYPKPLHLQRAFANLGYRPGAFPISEDAASRIFSLPMHPYLLESDQQFILSIEPVAKPAYLSRPGESEASCS
jgi:dTDP-4-amino-4,6-dideoxygalactose transaminase